MSTFTRHYELTSVGNVDVVEAYEKISSLGFDVPVVTSVIDEGTRDEYSESTVTSPKVIEWRDIGCSKTLILYLGSISAASRLGIGMEEFILIDDHSCCAESVKEGVELAGKKCRIVTMQELAKNPVDGNLFIDIEHADSENEICELAEFLEGWKCLS